MWPHQAIGQAGQQPNDSHVVAILVNAPVAPVLASAWQAPNRPTG
jgi:hypothetical protein